MADNGSKDGAADPQHSAASGAAGDSNDKKPSAPRRRSRRRPRRNDHDSSSKKPDTDYAAKATGNGAAGRNNNDPEASSSGGKKRNHRNRRRNNHHNKKQPQSTTQLSSSNDTNGVEQAKRGGANSKNSSGTKNKPYPPHWTLEECLTRYNSSIASSSTSSKQRDDSTKEDVVPPVITVAIIRGQLRVLPGGREASSFVACDRGSLLRDVLVEGTWHRNRALDGDWVFVELLPLEENAAAAGGDDDRDKEPSKQTTVEEYELAQRLQREARISENENDSSEGVEIDLDAGDGEDGAIVPPRTWQDDEIQMDLWNPQVTVVRQERLARNQNKPSSSQPEPPQRRGRVVHVIPPKSVLSELEPDTGKSNNKSGKAPRRRIVGSLLVLNSGTILLTPNNRSLPQFKCPQQKTQELIQQLLEQEQQHHQERDQSAENHDNDDAEDDEQFPLLEKTLFRAEYVYGSWHASHRQWPPCINVEKLGEVGDLEDEIAALLGEFQVDHGEFPAQALKDVDQAVRSGVYQDPQTHELGWKPTPAMCKGRRDYRRQRIFTIDPTTAKDLDDALHITQLPDGTIEVGVHIADVSYFVRPDTTVDREALRRATTVYLVDRTVPMLPRPLCEVACSLNENVDRLAFSCVWRMNADGTLRMKKKNGSKKEEDVWYGRTVIRSCARLDYATAQNIIDGKLTAPTLEDTPEDVWPTSRRPTGGHTMEQVAADVRLMHRVATARRRLRFENGALALDSVKLTFQLAADGQTPLLAAPYPIRDSNRLVEEYMLLANYLVAQRLITHAKERACLRFHPPPLMESLDRVAAVAKAGMDFDLDYSSSEGLHKSLVRLGRVCDDPLVLKCVTQMLTLPMQQAQYFCAGAQPPEMWRHFALNMPYYTHFTSPIRRYPDVIVHRLLQATIDDTVEDFPQDVQQIQLVCDHCSEKQKASKEAQARCDRVFLSLYLRKHPLQSELGIVLSVGAKAFTVYIPSLGADALLYLDEHKDMVTWADEVQRDGTRRILVKQKAETPGPRWETLDVRVFTKVRVTVVSKDKPPVDIKLRLEGPWERQGTITI